MPLEFSLFCLCSYSTFQVYQVYLQFIWIAEDIYIGPLHYWFNKLIFSKITSWAKYDQEIKYFLSNENRFLMVRTQCVLLVIWNDIFFEFGSKKFSKFNNDAVKIVEHLIIASTIEMLVDIFLLIQIMLQYIKEWMKLSLIHRTIHTHDSITWIDIYVTRIDCTWIDRDNREIN